MIMDKVTALIRKAIVAKITKKYLFDCGHSGTGDLIIRIMDDPPDRTYSVPQHDSKLTISLGKCISKHRSYGLVKRYSHLPTNRPVTEKNS